MYTQEKMACDRIVAMFAPRAGAAPHAAYFDWRRDDANPVIPCARAPATARSWSLHPAGAPFPCDCALGASPRPYAR